MRKQGRVEVCLWLSEQGPQAETNRFLLSQKIEIDTSSGSEWVALGAQWCSAQAVWATGGQRAGSEGPRRRTSIRAPGIQVTWQRGLPDHQHKMTLMPTGDPTAG